MKLLHDFMHWINKNLSKVTRNDGPKEPPVGGSKPITGTEPLRPVRPIPEVIKEISDRVYQSVLVKHLTVADPEQLRGWIELGVSAVRNHWLGPFDPLKYASDAALQKELQSAETAVVAARNDEGRARTNQRLARLAAPKKETRPSLPTPIIFAGVGGFTMLFTFTFVELPMLSGIDDMQARILFAGIPGFVLASMVVFSAFHVRTKDDTAAVIFTKAGLKEMTWQTASGLSLILGMGIVRFTLTSGWNEQLFCIGLMVVEAALWGYMKTAACRNSELQDEFDRRHEGDPQKEQDAELRDQFWREDNQALSGAIAGEAVVRQKLAWRAERDFDLEAMTRFAVAEIESSYLGAIGDIKGQTVIGNVRKDFDVRFRANADHKTEHYN